MTRGLRLASNYWYDWRRFAEHGSPFRDFENSEQLLAYVWMLAHAIEKGLALPAPQPGFGKGKVPMLLEAVELYLDQYGQHKELSGAVGVMDAYVSFNEKSGCEVEDVRKRWSLIQARLVAPSVVASGGVAELSRADVRSRSRTDMEDLFCSRHSVRQFAEDPIDLDTIRWAVHMAQMSPSVCNRQASRVYVYDTDEEGEAVLACQTGNRGFGDSASRVLVVTVDIRRFLSVGERNQCWIDGGMFAMSLVWALHSMGVGTCCLNWSAERDQDERLRRVAEIPASENVIMLLAVGAIPDHALVARSPRRDPEDVLVYRGRE